MADDYDLMKYDNRQSSIINHQTSARRPGEIKLEKFLDRSGLPYFRHNLGAISIIETETETMANMETRLAARIAELLEDYCGWKTIAGYLSRKFSPKRVRLTHIGLRCGAPTR
jgi:hypothetical protein